MGSGNDPESLRLIGGTMKTRGNILLSVLLCFLLAGSAVEAKNPSRDHPFSSKIMRLDHPPSDAVRPDKGLWPPSATSANSTTFLAYYTFDSAEGCDPQGWTSHDLTEQDADYWHVTDFATGGEACGPGTFGRLVVLEGSQSLWCGACPDAGNVFLCNYATLPGYGNSWDQAFCTKACLSVDSNVVIDFLAAWDSEPGYDATTIEIDNCDDNWVAVHGGIGVYDGVGSGFESVVVPNETHGGALRVRFHFVSDGGWSDQDGLWDTDGAFILDSLSVSDAGGVVLAVEDFEDELVGGNDATDWESCTIPGYGDYAQLANASGILQEGECQWNYTCVWNFYKNSTYDYACNTPDPAPWQPVVPYVNDRDQYISNAVWSPEIPFAGSGSEVVLLYDMYEDLKLDALVLDDWWVRSIVDGCPTPWVNRGFRYWMGGKGWRRAYQSFGDLIVPGASHIQVALGVRDMCGFWCGVYGTGDCHSHAPLYDNVEIYRLTREGPQFAWRDIDEWHDNFSTDGTITGTCRIDMAQDVLPNSNPAILPGDSAVIQVTDPVDGLAGDPNTGWGPAIYTYVHVMGGSYDPLAMQSTHTRAGQLRFPYVGDVVAAHPLSDGTLGGDPPGGAITWHVFRHDTCFTSGGGMVADRYCIDLNDDLFVPGDTIWFFRGARNTGGVWRYQTGGDDQADDPGTVGSSGDINFIAANADEMTCLPAAALVFGNDILYVDGMNFRSAQWAFDSSFERLGIYESVDRFDIRGPSSAVGNHLASRVVDPVLQLSNVYRQLIWNCGDLTTAFGDASGTPDKSDDTGVLTTYLDNLPNLHPTFPSGGVYLEGDDVAEVWNYFTSASAQSLRFYLSYSVVSSNHVAAGAGVSPWVVWANPPIDTVVAYGGCPLINDFDVLGASGASLVAADYVNVSTGTPIGGAIVHQHTGNPNGAIVSFVLSGFSLHYLRDDDHDGIADRWEHLNRVFGLLGDSYGPVTGPRPDARVNSLSQNYPNPFNPTTTIAYTIKEPGRVSLKVYNVAGQLVKTLVDEFQRPDAIKPVHWDGRNNTGHRVSSGVYFYKLVTKGFTKTKKMVLLK